jgi:hypothetical protein
VRKVNLRLDLITGRPARTCRLGGAVAVSRRATQFLAYFLRLVVFQRTGMGLLLGDPDFCKHIENGLALDFQFSRQIVDSNLTHPPLLLLCSIR